MLANLYLSDMDHLLSEKHHVHYKARFADDYLILGYSKAWLWRILGVIREELNGLGLEIKPNWQIYPIAKRPIQFLGYVIYTDHIMLKKSTKKRMQRKAKAIEKRQKDPSYILTSHDLGVIHSYEGCLKWCNGRNLAHMTFDNIYLNNNSRIKGDMSEYLKNDRHNGRSPLPPCSDLGSSDVGSGRIGSEQRCRIRLSDDLRHHHLPDHGRLQGWQHSHQNEP